MRSLARKYTKHTASLTVFTGGIVNKTGLLLTFFVFIFFYLKCFVSQLFELLRLQPHSYFCLMINMFDLFLNVIFFLLVYYQSAFVSVN